MSKLKVLLIIGITLVFVSMTGTLILIKNRFHPSVVRTWIIQAMYEALPGAEVTINDIQLNFGLNIYIRLADVSLRTKEKSAELFNVHSCVIKLPLWALLTGQGVVEVLVEKPSAYYLGHGEANNWVFAMHSTITPHIEDSSNSAVTLIKKREERSGHSTQFKFISKILRRLVVNVKMGDLHIIYNFPENQSGKLHIEKFIIKGLNLESQTAFELASNVTLGLGKQIKTQFELLAIGQFNFSDILFNSVIKTKALVHLKNFITPPETMVIPEIKSEIDLTIDKNNNLHGPIILNFGGSAISANMKGTIENPAFESLTIDLLLDDISTAMVTKYDKLSFGSSRIHIDGMLKIREEKIFPELKFGLSSPILYKNESLKASISLAGILRDGKYDISSIVDIFGGNINANLKGTLDVNDLPDKLEKLPPFTFTMTANKLQIAKETIRSLIYQDMDESHNDTSPNRPQTIHGQKQQGPLRFPPGEISVVMNEIMTGVTPLSAEAHVRIKPNSFDVTRTVLKYAGKDAGILKFSSNVRLGANQNISGSVTTNFQTFNVQGLYPFLPKFTEGITGLFTGKIHTKFSFGDKREYEIGHDIAAKNGEVRGINFKEKIISILEKWRETRGKEADKFSVIDDFDQHFDSFELQGRLTDSGYQVKKLDFSGGPKRISVKSMGKVYQQDIAKDGELLLLLSDIKLKRYFGTTALPMRFYGKGYWPTMDYVYTLEKLGATDNAKKQK